MPSVPPATSSTPPVVVSSEAGPTKDPWVEITRLTYGGDRSYAWSVREQVILCAPENRPKLEERLIAAVTRPGCTDAGLAALCELLGLIGSARSVPALAALLLAPATVESGRAALESIPGPEAVSALRDALPRLSGNARIGLIGSLARRRDTLAMPALTALRDRTSEPADLREAATRALDHLSRA
ncbi:MAG: hypothetical protein JNN01_20900 [Opitutaceae bacterium]|nr:hypothetical protein [Opitutaceae bacterium]